MRCVLVSSPGAAVERHWSHDHALQLATALAAAGESVLWFAPMRAGQREPAAPPGIELRLHRLPPAPPLSRVAAGTADAELERLLAVELRSRPAEVVVHVGAGARGSTNLAWLAARMGSVPFAVVRAAEVVCQRGDLVDAAGQPCASFLDPERCRRCCGGRWFRGPAADDFRNRSDLLAGSLLACEAVFVAAAAEVPQLTAFGVAAAALVVDEGPAAVVARLRANLPRALPTADTAGSSSPLVNNPG